MTSSFCSDPKRRIPSPSPPRRSIRDLPMPPNYDDPEPEPEPQAEVRASDSPQSQRGGSTSVSGGGGADALAKIRRYEEMERILTRWWFDQSLDVVRRSSSCLWFTNHSAANDCCLLLIDRLQLLYLFPTGTKPGLVRSADSNKNKKLSIQAKVSMTIFKQNYLLYLKKVLIIPSSKIQIIFPYWKYRLVNICGIKRSYVWKDHHFVIAVSEWLLLPSPG